MTWKDPTPSECETYLNTKITSKGGEKNGKSHSIGSICASIFSTGLSKLVDPKLLHELAAFFELDRSWLDTATKQRAYQRALACSVMDAWIFYSHSKARNKANHKPAELYLTAFKKSLMLPGFWDALQSLEGFYYKMDLAGLSKNTPLNLDEFSFDKNSMRKKELGLEHISAKDRIHAESITTLMTALSFADSEKNSSQIIKDNLLTIVQATMDGDVRFFKTLTQCINFVQPEDEYLSSIHARELPVTTPHKKNKEAQLQSKALWCRRHWISRLLWMMDRSVLAFEPIGLSKPQISHLYTRDHLKAATPPYFKDLFDMDATGATKRLRMQPNSSFDLEVPSWNYLILDLS